MILAAFTALAMLMASLWFAFVARERNLMAALGFWLAACWAAVFAFATFNGLCLCR